jgi:hypothetical protein
MRRLGLCLVLAAASLAALGCGDPPKPTGNATPPTGNPDGRPPAPPPIPPPPKQ